jgi:cytosine/adenosine deaminase-related metal-dependent hydrolase
MISSRHQRLILAICGLCLMKIAQASSILLYGGTIISFDTATSSLQVLRDSSLLIVDDRVQKLYSGSPNSTLPSDTQMINATNQIISPGFVDTHRHGWQTAFKTIGSNTSLAEYFSRFGEFFSVGKLDAEDVYIGQLAGVLEALNAGVTTILDHASGTWDNDTADAGLRGSIDSGARVFHSHVIHTLSNGYPIPDQIAKLKGFAALDLSNSSVEVGLAYDGWAGSPADEVNQVVAAAKYNFPFIQLRIQLRFLRTTNLSVITTHYVGGPWGAVNSPPLLHSFDLLNISTPVVFSHGSFHTAEDAGLLRSTNQYLSTTPESEFQYGHGNPHSELILDQAAIGVDTHFTFSTDIIGQVRFWLQNVRHRFYNQVDVDRYASP